MKIVETANATGPLADYVREARQETVILTVDGKPVAALVSIENADLETATLSSDPTFLALIERSRARRRSSPGISSQQMRRRLGLR